MPNKNEQPGSSDQELEKKVDQMMSPDTQDSRPTKPEPVAADITSQPSGVPGLPKELAKGLDAFSTEAPDITTETTAESTEEESIDPLLDPEKADIQGNVDAAPAKKVATGQAIDNPATDEAVTEIVREESDQLLDVDDAASAAEQQTSKHHNGSTPRWWKSKKCIYAVLFVIIASGAGAAAWPASRYMLLNTAGVRSSASVKIIDERTKLPLSNVQVSLGKATTKTDEKGVAKLDMVRLGKQPFTIQRVAFAAVKKDIVVGWGSNPLGDIELNATGARYEITVTDFVSGKPITAEASSDDLVAVSDKKGVINLVLDDVNRQTVEITVQAEGYKTKKLTISADKKDVSNVVLVPSSPLVYVSKQSGKYDVYKIDADGENKELLLAGTGRENADIRLTLSPNGTKAALVSARGTKRDAYGNVLQSLTLIDVKTKDTKTLDDANAITPVDWSASKLIYTANYVTDAKDTTQQRLVSYDTDESARTALATGSYLVGVPSVIGGYVYYATVNDDPATTGYQRIKIDGTDKQVILQARLSSVVRTDYDALSLQTTDGWFTYKVGNSEATKSNAPDANISKIYTVSPDGAKSLWFDTRDGKGTVLVRNQRSGNETVLVATGGLTVPLRWLNNTTVVYRVSNLNETADYVVSTLGGQLRKITNVTNTAGLAVDF